MSDGDKMMNVRFAFYRLDTRRDFAPQGIQWVCVVAGRMDNDPDWAFLTVGRSEDDANSDVVISFMGATKEAAGERAREWLKYQLGGQIVDMDKPEGRA